MYKIIHSILDTDHYKMTMGQLVYLECPQARARYKFINRGAHKFPDGFHLKVRQQIEAMADLKLMPDEYNWMQTIPYFRQDYINWLNNYRYNPDEVKVTLEDGALNIEIEGLWKRAIYWEVPLMALVSGLYFANTQLNHDAWKKRLINKCQKMSEAGCQWSDFGTRRRFSSYIQNQVVNICKNYKGFIGTSNPSIAQHQNVQVIGTYAHEGPMAMQGLNGGIRFCNKLWLDLWRKTYPNTLRIVLPDTVTSPYFLRDFDKTTAEYWDGFRQDSGNADVVCDLFLNHYDKLGIDSRNKTVIFSDGLNADRLIRLTQKYRERINVIGGIGTNLTNDVGVEPLNMVIKMSQINFGAGWINVVKLSDSPGKFTGDETAVKLALTDIREIL